MVGNEKFVFEYVRWKEIALGATNNKSGNRRGSSRG